MTMFQIPDEPFALELDEWPKWEAEAKRKYPVRWLFGRTIPNGFNRFWREWVHEPWYWFKCWAWKRYNVVVCRDLPPTWNDRDDMLLHASFQILKDFVEQEDRASHYLGHTQRSREQLIADYHFSKDPQHFTAEQIADGLKWAEQRADEWLEVAALYDWWEERRKFDDEPDDQYERDNDMLRRLIAVRGHLWT